MPGRRLNDDERALLNFWRDPPANLRRPILRSIQIEGGTGIRGINGLIVPFRYPITAICGNNGVGKTTILALAALAHHSPRGWFVHWGNAQAHRKSQDRTYYTFPDFFVHDRSETQVMGVSVTWRYLDEGRERSYTTRKTHSRWGSYSDRKMREVDFLPIARLLPAYELTGVRSTFLNSRAGRFNKAALSDEYRGYLSFIMGKEYSDVEVQESHRYAFQRCHSGVAYTAFNMGGGESSIITLLYLLQRIPEVGLIVIEEIEAGLHPYAQQKLAEVITKISREKKIQIICSTHSEIFIDALPRQARLLMRRSGSEHSVIESPSTRFSVYEMTGVAQPELIIYCEDSTAATLIIESLSQNHRLRVVAKEVGDGITVVKQGTSHIRAGLQPQSLCALDGDCSAHDIRQWIRSESGGRNNLEPDFLQLPGDNLPPERWVVEQLQHPDYRLEFARQFNCTDPEAQEHIEYLRVQLDHHDLGYVLHQRTNLGQRDCVCRTMRAVAPRHPQLEELRNKVRELLD